MSAPREPVSPRGNEPAGAGEPRTAVTAAIALGSNLGDRRAHLDGAVRELAAVPGVRVVAVSSWFETAPVGGPAGQGPYLNGAVLVRTVLAPRALHAVLDALERAHGRVRDPGERDGPRTLDLDLLVHGDQRVDEPDLVVPHPRLAQRAFVLVPLAEIAPDLVVPLSTGPRSVRELLAALRRPGREVAGR